MEKFEVGDIVKYVTETSGIYMVEVTGPGRSEYCFSGVVVESNYHSSQNGVGITSDVFLYGDYAMYKKRPDPMIELIRVLNQLEKKL